METMLKQIEDTIEKDGKVLAEILKDDVDILNNRLVKMADSIDNEKVMEVNLKKEKTLKTLRMLSSITNEIDEGILVLDSDGLVTYANCSTFKILGIDENSIDTLKVNFEPTGRVLMDKTEYRLELGEKSLVLIGDIKKIETKEEGKQVILIFNKSEGIIKYIEKLSTMEDFVVLDNILGNAEEAKGLKSKVLNIAKANSTILLLGETGVGKSLFARIMHRASYRKDKPFITVNCSVIQEELSEVEKYGQAKDSNTDISVKFAEANHGTVFIDEIEAMPPFMQIKLLRVLQDMEMSQIDEKESLKLDVRVIASTNKNLLELVEKGQFREDLYYKLSVIPISIPPLRKRTEDIKLITYYYLNKYSKIFNKKFVGIDKEVWEYMSKYDWPGNLRELQNAVEFMVNMVDNTGIVSVNYIPQKIREKVESETEIDTDESLNLKKLEFETIKKALSIYSNSKKGKQAAADVLGIGIATLYRKIDEYNLLNLK